MRVASSSMAGDDPYFRGRALDQYSVNAVSSALRNHSATSLASKGRSPRSRLRLSKSVISTAVLGFLILFNACKMCSLRRRLEFEIFFIAVPPSEELTHLMLRCLPRLHGDTNPLW